MIRTFTKYIVQPTRLSIFIAVLFITFHTTAHSVQPALLERQVTISLDEVSLSEALNTIGSLSKVKMFFSLEQLQLKDKVSISANAKPLGQLLDELLLPLGISYKVFEKEQVIVVKRNAFDVQGSITNYTAVDNVAMNAQTVEGQVTEATTHRKLSGVNIIIKGTTTGTTTDADGSFAINAEENSVLVFSYIGYLTFEVKVGGSAFLEVALQEDVASLAEVQVNAGYWQTTEKESTGSIVKITSEVIAKQPVSNPLAAMIGRMPGVYIQQTTGVPGGGFNIQIRGQNSLRNTTTNNGNLPLYIIDGVPSTAASMGFGTLNALITSGGNPLNTINPADIESIEVLKDADATSIYGSRGANGVVLITTRRGKSGSMNVNLTFSQGISQVAHRVKLMDTDQYLEMRNEAFVNDNTTPKTTDYDVNGTWDKTRYTDWQKLLVGRSAPMTNAQLSMSGGTDNTQYLLSGGYYKESSVFSEDFSNRKLSAHINLNTKSNDGKFKVLFSGTYVAGNNKLPTSDLTSPAIKTAPNAPAPLDELGNLNWENETFTANPLAILQRSYTTISRSLVDNTTLTYEFFPGFSARANVGFTSMTFDEQTIIPKSTFPTSFGVVSGFTNSGSHQINTWLTEPQLEYKKKISTGELTVLAGSTIQETRSKQLLVNTTGYSSDAQLENLAAATSVTIAGNDNIQYRFASLFGRVNYTFNEKYIVNLTIRRDGSSRFGPNRKFATFGAAGAAWIFSKENFALNNLSFLSFGKIRASVGTTGSDQLTDYGYLSTYSSTTNSYQGRNGLVPTRLFNPDYAWERTTKMELGIDLAFLQDRISLATGMYRNRSSNQLVGYTLAPTAGFSSVQQNLEATVQNTGVEFVLNTKNLSQYALSWSTSVNLTIPRNKLISYPGLATSSYANTYEVGTPLSIVKALAYTGVDPTSGLYTFEDYNNNGISYNDYPGDAQALKSLTQRFYGGLQNTLSYNGIQLDFMFQFVKQVGTLYIANSEATMPGTTGNKLAVVMNRWVAPGNDPSVQKFSQNPGSPAATAYNNSINYGDNRYGDASFIRLKNVELSWELPTSWSSKLSMSKVRIFVQGQNLLLITNYVGNDPENQALGVLPPLRVIMAGLNIGF